MVADFDVTRRTHARGRFGLWLRLNVNNAAIADDANTARGLRRVRDSGSARCLFSLAAKLCGATPGLAFEAHAFCAVFDVRDEFARAFLKLFDGRQEFAFKCCLAFMLTPSRFHVERG